MVDYWFTTLKGRGSGFAAVKDMGLTPGHLRVLMLLREGEAPAMGALVKEMQIHASMCTWLIDGLEERGFVERRTLPSDRRVKTIVLTSEGVEAKQRLLDAFYEPPPEFAALPAEQLRALCDALGFLPTASPS